jgi:hypothetical protein
MKITYLALLAVLALASSAATFAQTPCQNEPSVTLSVSPPQITPGGHVTLSGQGYPQAGMSVKDDFPVTTQGQTMMLQRTDSRDYPGRGNDAVYTFQLKACNPGC